MAQANVEDFSISVLRSAVRGVHVYNLVPEKGTFLSLAIDNDSTFKNSVFVKTVDGAIVGHVAK